MPHPLRRTSISSAAQPPQRAAKATIESSVTATFTASPSLPIRSRASAASRNRSNAPPEPTPLRLRGRLHVRGCRKEHAARRGSTPGERVARPADPPDSVRPHPTDKLSSIRNRQSSLAVCAVVADSVAYLSPHRKMAACRKTAGRNGWSPR